MPYKRHGLCVFKENPDGSLGKRVGCSKTTEGAKAFLRAKYAHANDAKAPAESKKRGR